MKYFVNKFFLAVISIYFINSCQTTKNELKQEVCFSGVFNQKVTNVEIDDFSTIKKLNGMFVQMRGVLSFNFEDVAIYPSNSDKSKKAFWLEFAAPSDTTIAFLREMSGKEVVLVGRVNLDSKGHLNAYRGTIDSVFCVK